MIDKKNKQIVALIPSAGVGKRMNLKDGKKKNFLTLNGKEILCHTLLPFEESDYIDEIIIITSPEDIEYVKKEIIEKNNFTKVRQVIAGGTTRQASVYNGFKAALLKDTDIITIHDGARPLITKTIIEETIKTAIINKATVASVKPKDTVKVATNNIITETLDREQLLLSQTPQTFEVSVLKDAYKKADEENIEATDECMLVERAGYPVYPTTGSYENIKVTTIDDLTIAEAILNKRNVQ